VTCSIRSMLKGVREEHVMTCSITQGISFVLQHRGRRTLWLECPEAREACSSMPPICRSTTGLSIFKAFLGPQCWEPRFPFSVSSGTLRNYRSAPAQLSLCWTLKLQLLTSLQADASATA
jgi:hypothetical protein